MKMFWKALFAFAVLTSVATAARADITYSYVDTASTSGGVTTLSVFLSEGLTNGSSSFIQANNGLFGAGFGITETSGNATITGGTFNTTPQLNGFGPNTSNTLSINAVPGVAATAETVALGSTTFYKTPTSTTVNGTNTTNLYLLGTYTIQGGTQTGTFNLTDLNKSPDPVLGGGSGNTITQVASHDLDFNDDNGNLPTGTYIGADNFVAVFTVAPASVPEPSSILLCGLATLGGAYNAYRRRRAKNAAQILAVA